MGQIAVTDLSLLTYGHSSKVFTWVAQPHLPLLATVAEVEEPAHFGHGGDQG